MIFIQCYHCGATITPGRRSDTKYCDARCQQRHLTAIGRREVYKERRRAKVAATVIKAQTPNDVTISSMRRRVVNGRVVWHALVWDHPYCSIAGVVPEHRLAKEFQLGHFIDPARYDIHHRFGVSSDNFEEHLDVVPISQHRRGQHLADVVARSCEIVSIWRRHLTPLQRAALSGVVS